LFSKDEKWKVIGLQAGTFLIKCADDCVRQL